MDKLEAIIKKCRASIHLEINDHKSGYETVEEYFRFKLDKPSLEILKIMIEKDRVISLQFYPDTPCGCYIIYHYDIDQALDEALKILNIEMPILPS